MTCEECGAGFRTTWRGRPDRKPKFCSGECRRLAAARRSREWRASHPEEYAAKYEAELERRRKATLDRAAARSCPYCGGPMPPRRRKYCGALKCKGAYHRERNREWMRKYKAEHGVPYVARYRGPDHVEKLNALTGSRSDDPARKQERWQRRRAQKLATTVEKFRHEDVYERDGWICGLCREPVDRELRYPNPKSPSLDHVIPLSRGGHHVLENVQLAHLTCNVKKQARIAEEEPA